MALNSHGLNLMGDYPMKLSHLLTGAALVALTAGAAQAQFLTIGEFDGTATNNDSATAPIYMMSELDLAAAAPTASLEFQLDLRDIANPGTVGAFDGLGAGDSATITFTLTGAEWGSGVNASSYVGGEGTAPAITAGGASGESTITYTIASNANNYDDAVGDLEFKFPIEFNASGANISVVVASGGNTLYSETFDAAPATVAVEPLFLTRTGFTYSNAAGTQAVADASPASGIPFDALVTSPVTTNTVTVAPRANTLFSFGASTDSADNVNAALATSQVANATVSVAFPNTPQNVALSIDGQTASATTLSRTVATADVGTTTFALSDITANNTVIPVNNPTATLQLNAAASTNLTFAPQNVGLQAIIQEGFTGQTFEWVGSGSNAQSVFRITGGAPSDQYFVTLNNTQNGSDGVYDLTPTLPYSNGEVVFTSADLAAQAGEFVRANATVTVVRNGASGAFPGTIRRFIAGANGTLTTFDGDFSSTCSNLTLDNTGAAGTASLSCDQ